MWEKNLDGLEDSAIRATPESFFSHSVFALVLALTGYPAQSWCITFF